MKDNAEAVVGSYIRRDGVQFGANLLPCDDWDRASFRWPNPIPEWRESHAIACNVEITGRTIQRYNGALWVRVKITWVGDREPDTTTGGYMLLTEKER
jgi:hypothetical protein